MKKTIVLLFILVMICLNGIAQDKFNIVCRDFTFQQEISTTGKNLRNVFEVAISKYNHLFKVFERDKMDKFFEALQEEKNLFRDLSTEWKRKLKMANIDYLVVGELNENIASNNFDLIINFIKITGDNITEKIPMLITIDRKQISNNEIMKAIFDKEIHSFIKSYFIIGNESNLSVPQFYQELKVRDSIINNLSNEVKDVKKKNLEKIQEIEKLNESVSNIKNYSNMARLDSRGAERHFGHPFTGTKTSLESLINNIVEIVHDSLIYTKNSDTALLNTTLIINKYPNFPFGYYYKAIILFNRKDNNWIIFAEKAIDIFKFTTQISGHKEDHDQAMFYLVELLKFHRNDF